MNRIRSIVPALLILASPLGAYAQTRTTTAITSQTLASQPAGTPYVLSSGLDTKVFSVSPDTFSRVQLSGATGPISMTTVAMKLGAAGAPILVGTFASLSAIDFGITTGGVTRPPVNGVTTTAVKCDGDICGCVGKIDCRDMGRAGVCYGGANRNWWACDAKGCVCLDKKGML